MVDYSKWKDIEVSDDEDDTHPNIDTPSLFKWRHEARVQRMEEMEVERKKFEERKNEFLMKKRQTESKGSGEGSEELAALKLEEEKIKKEEEELKKRERLTPWNVDTIAKPGFSKTVINTPKPKPVEELTEEERAKRLQKFIKDHESKLKKFGMLRKYEDSKRFLQENPDLACEDTANYLTIWCVDLAVEEKFDLMDHVSHQAIAIQFLLELAKQTDVDPRACAGAYFAKMQHVDQTEYKEAFDTELRLFRERIRKRAEQKIAEAMEEERQARLGPGGLDPLEVLETLPPALRECFEKQDIPLLQKVIKEMDLKDAEYHMKRCVDSGLWVPPPKDSVSTSEETAETEVESKTEKPEI